MKRHSEPIYVIDGLRAPILKARGKPGPFTAANLATQVVNKLLLRNPQVTAHIDTLIAGCVMPRPDEANIARIIGLRCGLPNSVPAFTVQRNCASGMQALHSAMEKIATGGADIVLAGGVEAMSHAPLLYNDKMVNWLSDLNRTRTLPQRLRQFTKWRPAMLKPVIALRCGLTDSVVNLSMGQTAEELASRFSISRTQMDEYALRSHQLLCEAQKHAVFEHEITAVYDQHQQAYQQDDGVRADSSMEKLAKLKPVFDHRYGHITAGNSAQISDGAAFLILAGASAVDRLKLTPVARLMDCQWAGLDPAQMGLGPVYASHKLLAQHQLTLADIEYWEINEAFAAQVLACLQAFSNESFCSTELDASRALGEIALERLNIHGGAIACGHPVGMTGARIVLHMIQVLKQQQAQRGIATLCIGGGQGGAMLVEVQS